MSNIRRAIKPKLNIPLRQRAETQLHDKHPKTLPRHPSTVHSACSSSDTQRLLHELQVQQIELELQNEELQEARNVIAIELEKYSELYDFAPVGYMTLDAVGTIKEANQTAATLLGIPKSKLVNRCLGFLITAEKRAQFVTFLHDVFETKSRMECDIQVLVNEHLVHVRLRATRAESGHVCWMALSDITQHKLAEEQLQVSEIRYRRLFETAHDGVLLLDPVTCKITDANPFMTHLLGYKKNQLIGKELYEIGLLKDKKESQAMFQELAKTHKVRYENLPLKHQDGQQQEVEVVANLYRERGYDVIQCNIRDITARRKTEKELANAQSKLTCYAEKLESLVSSRTLELTTTNTKLKKALVSIRKSKDQYQKLFLASQMMQEKLRLLAHQIIVVQEEERKEISRELHDVVVQTLIGINMELSALRQGHAGSPVVLKTQVAKTQKLLERAVATMHDFARDIRPAVLDDIGLLPALQAYCMNLTKREKFKVKLTAYSEVDTLTEIKRTVLFRVAQEALTNVVRHAHATKAKINIFQADNAVQMDICDNGCSFNLNSAKKKNKRLGLVGMKERVEMIGGTLTLICRSGKGTIVRVKIPVAQEKGKKPTN